MAMMRHLLTRALQMLGTAMARRRALLLLRALLERSLATLAASAPLARRRRLLGAAPLGRAAHKGLHPARAERVVAQCLLLRGPLR